MTVSAFPDIDRKFKELQMTHQRQERRTTYTTTRPIGLGILLTTADGVEILVRVNEATAEMPGSVNLSVVGPGSVLIDPVGKEDMARWLGRTTAPEPQNGNRRDHDVDQPVDQPFSRGGLDFGRSRKNG